MQQDAALDLVLKLIDGAEDKDQFFIACKHPRNVGKRRFFKLFLYAYGGQVCQLNFVNNRCSNMKLHALKGYIDHGLQSLPNCLPNKKQEQIDLLEKCWLEIERSHKNWAYSEAHKQSERCRETAIAKRNAVLAPGRIAIVDMESNWQDIRAKPDLVGIRWSEDKLIIDIIEYKCTAGGLSGVTLESHYDDMITVFRDTTEVCEQKKSILASLSIMIEYGFITVDERIRQAVCDAVEKQNAEFELLFLFSHYDEMNTSEGKDHLRSGYEYIATNENGKIPHTFYTYIDNDDFLIDVTDSSWKNFVVEGAFDFAL